VIAKVCGITRAEDAQLAAALGATALGFIFWPSSPRAISPERARHIVSELPTSIVAVGVFVNASRDEIERVAAEVGLGAVQLHGSESPELARQLTRPVIKALPLHLAADDEVLSAWRGTTVLLDADDPVRRGGTGKVVDWDRAAAIARRHEVMLAGGLTPANVVEAIARVQPAGIDVSSGVEVSPGVKDPDKLRAFFEALARVEA
jgi:phosphoribosylanthranilate isomerase